MTPEIRSGFLAAASAYLMWGMLPLYLKLMAHLPALQVFAHRILWSVPAIVILLVAAGALGRVRDAMTPNVLKALVLSTVLIGVNWALYVWAVSAGRVMEASLGYYLNPLVNVAFGALLLKEQLTRAQWLAIGFAGAGVATLMLGLGHLPWVALVLCFTFAFYGLVRKQTAVDARAGLLIETGLLAPFVAVGLWVFAARGGAVMGTGALDPLWLVLAGPVTAIPLILFAFGARRVRFSTLGMLQYVAPTLQFATGLAFGEVFTPVHAVAFGLIWTGLAIFTWDAVKRDQANRRAAKAALVL
jgi:chloramphenicol-sensitive protein RarD